MSRAAKVGEQPPSPIRCAIYTRKSSDDGLDQEFNSLDAQRESAEAFIASQKAEGWRVIPDRYDDGGFSGGNMERPALDRLLRDINAGKIDCVVVYKVDRLSRSLMDFSRIMETFENAGVSFVSVTQQFNTTHSMGRLTLNILLSFAQFEREIIGERIRDKIAAQKRKGKWTGGVPVLGYDVDRSGPSPRLVINAREAQRVKAIFKMYLDLGSMLPVVKELRHREWVNKRRTTKRGSAVGGRPFDKATLYALLRNPVVTGKITHKGEIYEGEHEAIVEQDVFDQVQALLSLNGRTGGPETRNKYGAILRGLLRCRTCDQSMVHTFCGGKKKQFYRYYRCVGAMKNGVHTCPAGSIPAQEIERLVVDEIRGLSADAVLLDEILRESQSVIEQERLELSTERDGLRRDIGNNHRALRRLVESGGTGPDVTARLADLNEQIAVAERRVPEIEAKLAELDRETISRDEAEAALADFESIWASLAPREQSRLLNLLIERVEYDGAASTVSVTFRPSGIGSLIATPLEEAA